MNKIISRASIISAIAIGLFAVANVALADIYTGKFSTGLDATIGNQLNSVVISTPIANPPAGVYASAQSVTLTASGATSIYYTIDGSSPTCSAGNLYSGAIDVSVSEPIEAISCYPYNASSTVASYLYAINPASDDSATVTNTVSSGGGGGGGGGGISDGGNTSSAGTVGISDFVLLMENWGKPGQGNPADWSGDATVGIQDFIWLMANWNS